jgi:hypothetical protein
VDVEALELLVDELVKRRGHIRRLIDEFRQSSRAPFPHWTEAVAVTGMGRREA